MILQRTPPLHQGMVGARFILYSAWLNRTSVLMTIAFAAKSKSTKRQAATRPTENARPIAPAATLNARAAWSGQQLGSA